MSRKSLFEGMDIPDLYNLPGKITPGEVVAKVIIYLMLMMFIVVGIWVFKFTKLINETINNTTIISLFIFANTLWVIMSAFTLLNGLKKDFLRSSLLDYASDDVFIERAAGRWKEVSKEEDEEADRRSPDTSFLDRF